MKGKHRKTDNRGLTLVELICTVAILGLISAGIASVMVVSARNYQRGSEEAELQQAAQLAVNQIEDLIIDATSSLGGSTGSLRIVKDTTLYEVAHDGSARTLLYSEYIVNPDGVTPVAEDMLLAENVDVFTVDASHFGDSGSMLLHMELSSGDRSYASDFTITSRNGRFVSGTSAFSASISVVPELVLEPGESHSFSVTVAGNLLNNAVNWTMANNTSSSTMVTAQPDGSYKIDVGLDETAQYVMFTVSTQEMDGLMPYAWQSVKVNVRRINTIDLVGVHTAGDLDGAGAEYTLTVNFPDPNLDQMPMQNDLTSYVNPRQVSWEYTLTDEDGNAVSNVMDYITPVENGITNVITFDRSLADYNLVVKATALHPDGTNRTHLDYGDACDIWSLHITIPSTDWARSGYSPMFLNNIDPNILVTDPDGKVYLSNRQAINLKWWRWTADLGWQFITEQGNQGSFGDVQNTDSGIKIFFENGKPEVLYGHLDYSHPNFSYSTPYYRGFTDVNFGVTKLKLQLDLGGLQSGIGIFNIRDVVFQYRNARDAAWSAESGGVHRVYVTPEDSADTYTVYFQLTQGWDNIESQAYVAYNRFVGVIQDNPGSASDAGYDLTFIDASGAEIKRDDKNENAMRYGLNFDIISSGTGEDSTITVKITQDEKDTLCAGTGTVIKEIYEYNPWFNNKDNFGTPFYDYLSADMQARVDGVDGCDGILEFHFVPANVQIVNHTDNKPAVMYCPDTAELGGAGYYYINSTSRYHVTSDTSAAYEINNGSGWVSQYVLSRSGSMWTD